MKSSFNQARLSKEVLDGFSITEIPAYFELTRSAVYHDFSYYVNETSRARMTGKAWAQYQRSRKLHGIEYAYREYIAFHTSSRWEAEFPEADDLCSLHHCPMKKCDDVIAAAEANDCDFATAAANLKSGFAPNLHKGGSAQ